MDPRAYTYLDQRLRMVETEVTYLRSLLLQASGAVAPASVPAGFAGPAPAAVPVVPAAPAKPVRRGFSLEAFIVGRGFQIVGSLILLLGAVLFMSVALPGLPPGARVTIGLLASVALIVYGATMRSAKWQFLGDGTIALGGGFGFLSIWAAGSLFQIVPRPAALLALFAVTAIVCALSYARRSERLAIAAAFGGYLAPLLLVAGRFELVPLFGYLFVLSAGLLVLSRFAKFRYLDLVGFLGVALYAPVFSVPPSASGAELGRSLGMVGALFAEFLAALHFAAHVDRKLSGDRIAVIAGCVGALVLALEVELADHQTILGAALFALAAVLVGSVRLRGVPAVVRETYAWLGLGSLTLAVPALAHARDTGGIWAIEAAALVAVGARVDRARIAYAGAGLFGVAFLDIIFQSLELTASNAGLFVPAIPSFLILAGSAAVAEAIVARSRLGAKATLRSVLQVATHVAALTGLSLELYDRVVRPSLPFGPADEKLVERSQFAVSLLWTFYAATLFGFGLNKKLATLRYLAIGLFVLTIGKVFSVDLAFLNVTDRFSLSFVLGLVLVGASVLYGRTAGRSEQS